MTPSQAAPSPTTHYLPRPDGRIAYDVRGDATATLAICVPGMGTTRDTFRFLVPQLIEAGLRVATMDLRGHGDSDPTFDTYDSEAVGTDAAALATALGADAAHPALLIGNSLGAAAAVCAAAEHPDLAAGIVLIGPFVRDPATKPGMATLMRVLLRRPWGPAIWATAYDKYFPGRKPADHDAQRAALRKALSAPGHWRAFQATARGSHRPSEQRLPRVAAPALVLMGTRDSDWPDPAAEATWIAAHLGDGSRTEVTMIDGAGHYPQAQYPEVVGPAVVTFARTALARTAPGRTPATGTGHTDA
jgi:pimeloyl-ACP methyl ester carboxylesterase